MGSLPILKCPGCGNPLIQPVIPDKIRAATSYQTCMRQCEKCGIGASNAEKNATYIYREPLKNIPRESRPGVLEVLERALNVRNRESKLARFGFSTSEDAVTWVVFNYLYRAGKLLEGLKGAGLIGTTMKTEPAAVLLWGVSLDRSPRGAELESRLKTACASLGEYSNSYSEPDVLIDLGDDGVIFIEVKYLSGNEFKNFDYSGWDRYSRHFPGRRALFAKQ